MESDIREELEEKVTDKFLKIFINLTEECEIKADHLPDDEDHST